MKGFWPCGGGWGGRSLAIHGARYKSYVSKKHFWVCPIEYNHPCCGSKSAIFRFCLKNLTNYQQTYNNNLYLSKKSYYGKRKIYTV